MPAYELKSRIYIFLVSFLLACLSSLGQNIPERRIITYDTAVGTVDTTVFGSSIQVKIDSDTLRLAFQKALSYYPEMWNKKIKLKYGRTRTSMSSRPLVLSVFRKKDRRSYKITVGNRESYKPAQLLNTAPFNALVGVLAHELAHIEDYSDRSGWAAAWMGVKYILSKKYRRQMERYTDSLAMSKGLQWQVYHYSYYVANEADIDENYRRYKLDVYMSPEEVQALATRMDSLQNIRTILK